MQRTNLSPDSHAISEFEERASSYVQQVTETKRPLVITQHGKDVAVLADINEFEAMRTRLELLEDIYRAESQINRGLGISHQEAKSIVMKGIEA